MIVFFDDEDLLPLEEQVNCLQARCETERFERCEVVRKSLNAHFMAARVPVQTYLVLSRKLNKLAAAQ